MSIWSHELVGGWVERVAYTSVMIKLSAMGLLQDSFLLFQHWLAGFVESDSTTQRSRCRLLAKSESLQVQGPEYQLTFVMQLRTRTRVPIDLCNATTFWSPI